MTLNFLGAIGSCFSWFGSRVNGSLLHLMNKDCAVLFAGRIFQKQCKFSTLVGFFVLWNRKRSKAKFKSWICPNNWLHRTIAPRKLIYHLLLHFPFFRISSNCILNFDIFFLVFFYLQCRTATIRIWWTVHTVHHHIFRHHRHQEVSIRTVWFKHLHRVSTTICRTWSNSVCSHVNWRNHASRS